MQFEITNPLLKRIAAGIVLVACLVVIGFGIKQQVSLPKNYVETTAQIVRLAEPAKGGYTTYRYEAQGKKYIVRVEEYSSLNHIGKEVKIHYNPDNPKEILSAGDMIGGFITMGIGCAGAVISLIVIIKNRNLSQA
ncbi:MAG: DUF3592 domain-containing protein [Clostridia bacterium]|nr:DUF3592 domain-containing protein [Clostridia bacterium]